ncbi:hypothetical protein HNQ07_002178 [Deinococcus metalli]|uniref:Uncharacterized protein n=1 Tax=Deinococcus metalli TaxID=1141878 RepID=A0A7W8NNB2_9DEIO|nr:hypothetical protein [Deinococcus metalli]MBB5376714.1 hypothetical protein [Deinococcus metalli]GHF44792.1 hypothetical protein GCM10017781_21420 [Deinococcus metalli]
MLSEEERRRIEAEEVAAAQARAAAQDAARHRLAALAYRREVRAALGPRPRWWAVRWALPFVPVVALVAWLAVRPAAAPAMPNDAPGGTGAADLVARCQTSVSAALLLPVADLRFPAVADAAQGISEGADGTRWNAAVTRPDGRMLDFTCVYSPADDRIRVDVLDDP